MMVASLITTPLALSELFFVPSYWIPDAILTPKLSIEDFIFSFAVGGIAAVLYELLMDKRIYHQRLCSCFQEKKVYPLILGIGILAVLASYFLFKINFMYAAYIGILVDIILMTIVRPDLFSKIIYSSILFGLFYTLFFAAFSYLVPDFLKHWNFSALSGYTLLNIPVEEIIWGFGIGGLLGPIYEYLLGLKIIRKSYVLKRENN